MATALYDTTAWELARDEALARDGHRCTVARLLGGACSETLHVHHIEPVREGGDALDLDNLATVCSTHHPRWEALRRAILYRRRENERPRCPHKHVHAAARELCEQRLARQVA